jgi:hypothetical protein
VGECQTAQCCKDVASIVDETYGDLLYLLIWTLANLDRVAQSSASRILTTRFSLAKTSTPENAKSVLKIFI